MSSGEEKEAPPPPPSSGKILPIDDEDEDKLWNEEKVNSDDSFKNFDLNVALQALSDDSLDLADSLAKDEKELHETRQNIVKESKSNFILERELADIEEKIKLWVKNRMTVQEVMATAAGINTDEHHEISASPLQGKRALYEDMFYLLQSKPHYFARMARLLNAGQVDSFVQTVVFDMYGDQYDTREERLLLHLFKRVLRLELASANSMGSLLRSNTAITQMLSAYARRGQGLGILRDILEEPIQKLTAQKNLNLEIDPMKIYFALITEYETKTGKISELPRDVDGAAAAKNPEVALLIAERTKLLLQQAETILDRIINGVQNVPYGMRWICKQLGQLSQERFPDAKQEQIYSLMGGYIYLRFFNPVIVAPDSVNFIKKPNAVTRRNLILVAKVLQNLSNGLQFGDHKEPYMKVCNPYIEERLPKMYKYFDTLVQVDDLQDALQVDKYLEHTQMRLNHINITLNQLFLIHQLLYDQIDQVASKKDDPMRALVQKLGAPPAQVPRDENRTVALQLIDRREQRISTAADTFSEPRIHPLYYQAKTLLLNVLRLIPPKSNRNSLLLYLEDEKKKAIVEGDGSLADHISNVMSMLHTLAEMGLLAKKRTAAETFDNFLWEIATEAVDRGKRGKTIEKRLAMVRSAQLTIRNHHKYLQERLEVYKIYLQNARKGQAQEVTSKDGKKIEVKKRKEALKLTHTELVDSGVIMKVDDSIPKATLKKCLYYFTMVAPGQFEIQVTLKMGFESTVLKEPVSLSLEELLAMQEHNTSVYSLDKMDFNVNLLIHLLNKHFIVN